MILTGSHLSPARLTASQLPTNMCAGVPPSARHEPLRRPGPSFSRRWPRNPEGAIRRRRRCMTWSRVHNGVRPGAQSAHRCRADLALVVCGPAALAVAHRSRYVAGLRRHRPQHRFGGLVGFGGRRHADRRSDHRHQHVPAASPATFQVPDVRGQSLRRRHPFKTGASIREGPARQSTGPVIGTAGRPTSVSAGDEITVNIVTGPEQRGNTGVSTLTPPKRQETDCRSAASNSEFAVHQRNWWARSS